MEHLKSDIVSGIFVQVGAGAGDLDTRAKCRDGFSEFIKSLPKEKINNIILVEPNPINIPLLKKCWEKYECSEIHEIAITTKILSGKTLNFYYAVDDGPHYQVASINKNHVIKHYNNGAKIDIIQVPTISLEKFLSDIVENNSDIDLLALDIEGIDAEIILDNDFNKLNVRYLSFEHLHLGDKHRLVVEHLQKNGYQYLGSGVDHNGFDYLFKRVDSIN